MSHASLSSAQDSRRLASPPLSGSTRADAKGDVKEATDMRVPDYCRTHPITVVWLAAWVLLIPAAVACQEWLL